jgi:hypothetical protein
MVKYALLPALVATTVSRSPDDTDTGKLADTPFFITYELTAPLPVY